MEYAEKRPENVTNASTHSLITGVTPVPSMLLELILTFVESTYLTEHALSLLTARTSSLAAPCSSSG
jgi:hypothetical protein